LAISVCERPVVVREFHHYLSGVRNLIVRFKDQFELVRLHYQGRVGNGVEFLIEKVAYSSSRLNSILINSSNSSIYPEVQLIVNARWDHVRHILQVLHS
jgi:hypothetical protein